MTTNAVGRDLRRYLLGALDEEARQGVERRLMAEEELFEELLVVEEELTDQYLNEELSADERRGFEGYFLSTPERRRKLRFAKAFGRYVSGKKSGAFAVDDVSRPRRRSADVSTFGERARAFWRAQGPALRAAATFAAFVLVIGAAWLALRTPAPRTFVAVSLSPSASTRGTDERPPVVRLVDDADDVRATLTLPGGAPEGSRFAVELEDERSTLGRFEAERVDARTVSVVIPASRLARGQYALKVFETGAGGAGRRIPGTYLFNVE